MVFDESSIWQGAVTGLVVSGLNHYAHDGDVEPSEDLMDEASSTDPKPTPDPKKMDSRYNTSGKQWKKVGGRWTIINKNGEILQWDSKKGEVEIYKSKEHKGGYDPYNRNKQISKPISKREPNGGWKQASHKFFDVISKLSKVSIPIFNELWLQNSIMPNSSFYSSQSGVYY